MRSSNLKSLLAALAGWVALQAPSALACAVCYGESDAPIARGMAWGMLTLLVILIGVLGSIVAFFVHLGKRSAKVASAAPPEPLVQSAQQV